MEKGLSSILLQYHSSSREQGGRGLGLSMSNALQVVTEALATPTKLVNPVAVKPEATGQPDFGREAYVDNDVVDDDDDDDDNGGSDDGPCQPAQQQTMPAHLIGKTIVASDNDVTNGFVKDGKMLPYVFEATESGGRKRSSKILPVCGVCGKRFVCVTTMKRHLVTHTGERPFSCSHCGKQYTQKGNLRVHERTHRNSRPFECNICHQKFYRKEPMQKHQWRQHGVVHLKSRPVVATTSSSSSSSNNNNNNNSMNNIINNNNNNAGDSPHAAASHDSVLYTSLVQHIKQESSEKANSFYIRPTSDIVVAAVVSQSPLPPIANLLRPAAPAPIGRTGGSHEDALKSLPSLEPLPYHLAKSHPPFRPPTLLQSALSLQKSVSTPSIPSEVSERSPPPSATQSSPKPIKLKMKFAYHKEQEANHRREEEEAVDSSSSAAAAAASAASAAAAAAAVDDFESIPDNLGELKLRSSSASPTGTDGGGESCRAADPFQCIGCCVVFAHKPGLKAHQACADDKERPFRCCKCGYKFRQKAHLQKHQWRIHRRRYCDQDDSAASTTITMQDIINHGVEKSLQEMPVCHGKTSSKYYSEVLGLEYSGTEDSSSCSSSSDAQPLDLSPVKKKAVNPIQIRALEDNPLLSQPPLPRSPRPFGQGSSAVSSLPPSQPPPSSKPPPVHPELFPAWKKQRTETASGIPAAPSQAPSHRALPPISGLQKPPVFSLAAGNPASSPYRHSSWIRDSLSSRPADLTAAKKPATSDPATLHGQLSMLHGQNGRTV